MANPTTPVLTRPDYDISEPALVPMVGGATNTRQYQPGQFIGQPTSGSKQNFGTDFDDSQPMQLLGFTQDSSAKIAQYGSPNIQAGDADGANVFRVTQPPLMTIPLHSSQTATKSQRGAPIYAYDAATATLNATTYNNLLGWLWDVYDDNYPSGSPTATTGSSVIITPYYPGKGGILPSVKNFTVPLNKFKKATDLTANPPAADATNLTIVTGTYGTSAPVIQSEDAKTVTVSPKTRFQWEIGANYVAGTPISIIINAGMTTTVADASAFLQVDCYRNAAPTVNIGPSSAGHQSINSLTAANKTFVITPTNVVAGDILDIELTTAITDASTGTAVKATINTVTMQLAA